MMSLLQCKNSETNATIADLRKPTMPVREASQGVQGIDKVSRSVYKKAGDRLESVARRIA